MPGAVRPFVAAALAQAENGAVLSALRAAARWGWSPGRPWGVRGDEDGAVVLGLALQIYEDGLCSCGHPLAETSDDTKAEAYEVVERVCNVCSLVEARREMKDKPPAGWKVFARRMFASEIKPSRRRRR